MIDVKSVKSWEINSIGKKELTDVQEYQMAEQGGERRWDIYNWARKGIGHNRRIEYGFRNRRFER